MTSSVTVWVTGTGIVSSGGWSVDETWDAVVHGRSCGQKVERFPLFDLESRVGAPVPGVETELPETSLALRFAEHAILEALGQADLDPSVVAVDTVVVGNHGERGLPVPGRDPVIMGGAELARSLGSLVGARRSLSVYGACAGGALAIGAGMKLLEAGMAEVVVAGGADCLLREHDFYHFAGLYAMSTRDCPPEEASCPFDVRRDGFVLSEGAGFIVLETEAHARRRNSEPLAVLKGFGSKQSAYHIVASPPDGGGPSEAMAAALRDAHLGPEMIPYINAHGTSTRDNDSCETTAIHRTFGDHAKHLMVSSVKSELGHPMGAAGAIELALCTKILETGLVPPTINLEEPDPRCDLDYVPHEAREIDMDYVMSNSFGFGGHNAALVLGKA